MCVIAEINMRGRQWPGCHFRIRHARTSIAHIPLRISILHGSKDHPDRKIAELILIRKNWSKLNLSSWPFMQLCASLLASVCHLVASYNVTFAISFLLRTPVLKHCATWALVYQISRVKPLLVNNNFALTDIDKGIIHPLHKPQAINILSRNKHSDKTDWRPLKDRHFIILQGNMSTGYKEAKRSCAISLKKTAQQWGHPMISNWSLHI